MTTGIFVNGGSWQTNGVGEHAGADPGADPISLEGQAALMDGHFVGARDLFRAAICAGDVSKTTYLNLALAEYGAGNGDEARRIMTNLIGFDRDWDEPWVRLAEWARDGGDDQAADECYAQALERDPLRREALIGRAVVFLRRGSASEAQRLLLRCVGRHPDSPEAWDALGIAFLGTGDMGAAETAFAEACGRDPRNFEYAARKSEAAFLAGTGELELIRLEQAAAETPLNAALPYARGVLLGKMQRYDAAIDFLTVAALLEPEAAAPSRQLARMILHCPSRRDAIELLEECLRKDPEDIKIRNNMGAVLLRQHRALEAEKLLREVAEVDRDSPVALANLANATALLGDQDGAVAIARGAVIRFPRSVLARRALVNALPYAYGTGGKELLEELRQISPLLERGTVCLANIPDADRRVRLGLLSTSLRTHPVGWLTVAGFENLDPNQFEIVCLGQSPGQDMMTRRFQAIAASWHTIDGFSDAEIAALGRELQIDILIDLGGYGEAGRMTACTRRIAPIQVKWVGMQNHSSGLAEMDWFLSDRWETPCSLEHLYIERILRMPDGYVCYSPPPDAPDVGPLPALENGFVTFGCFHNLAKVTPQSIEVWSETLAQVAGSRLILKAHQLADDDTRRAIMDRFRHHGTEPDRVEFRGASPHREFLRQYSDIDISLDPLPYTGGLTTCEALWMGVPTVTTPGEIFASRHSLSHLSNVGLHDWVARDRNEYVELAVAKARDIDGLAKLRPRLRPLMRGSPLCDGPKFGANLGVALRNIWREWCDGKNARPAECLPVAAPVAH